MYVCVCNGEGGESVCDSYLLVRQEVFDNFYVFVVVVVVVFRASRRHLVCTGVLFVYARPCVSACVRYRSGKNNYVHGYTCK